MAANELTETARSAPQIAGLTVDEAARRLLRDGPNVLPAAKRRHGWRERVPFDAIRLRTSALVEMGDGERWLYVKGAPESVLGCCERVDGEHRNLDTRGAA